jgi:hypothetical protein
MNTLKHVLLSTIAAVIIWIFSETSVGGLLLFWLGAWLLIDLDHFIYTSIKEKEFAPHRLIWKTFALSKRRDKRSLQERKVSKYPIFIFHGLEIILILLMLSLFYDFAYYLVAGFLFHLFLDYVELFAKKENLLLKTSVVYVALSNKNKLHAP